MSSRIPLGATVPTTAPHRPTRIAVARGGSAGSELLLAQTARCASIAIADVAVDRTGTDTSRMSSRVLERQTALIRAMSSEQKVRQSEDLYRLAWELKAAWLRNRYPGLSEDEIQEQVRSIFRDAGG